jgi:sorting nexin-1/2
MCSIEHLSSFQWFEEKVQQVESLDSQLKNLLTRVEGLVYQRRELSLSTASFGKAVAMLSNCDEHTSLSRALSQLAEAEEKVEHVYLEQNNADFSIFCEMLRDYVSLIGAVKVCWFEEALRVGFCNIL